MFKIRNITSFLLHIKCSIHTLDNTPILNTLKAVAAPLLLDLVVANISKC